MRESLIPGSHCVWGMMNEREDDEGSCSEAIVLSGRGNESDVRSS
jgi:hypothetical protein